MPRNKKSTAAPTSTESPSAPAPEISESTPVGEGAERTSSASAFGKQESSGRIRGPVEEVIAKRVRTLGKKIQRFKAYSAQPVDKLNADQKAAIASLPILEAQSRELEDLIKSGGPVEVAELGEAAKMRGMKEESESKARSDAESSASAHQTSLAEPLSRFLRLHTLLHPARSADHEHLTFSPLDLPAQLQDEVQATDILRVGRMYEDLLAGGEKGAGVLGGLVKGSTGDDEENDHVHQLLELLANPKSESSPAEDSADIGQPESEPEAEGTAAGQEEDGDNDDVIKVDPSTTIEESSATLPVANGHSETTESTEDQTEEPESTKEEEAVPHPTISGGKGLVFLQEDELESEQQQGEVESENKEDGFEMIEQPQAHETEHYDTPAPAPTSAPAPAVEESTPAPAQESKSSFNWADDHDEEPTSASAPAETPKSADTPSGAQPTETSSNEKQTQAGEESTPPNGQGQGRGGRGGRRGGPSGGQRRGGGRNGQNGASGSTATGQVGLPIPPKPQGMQGGRPNKAGVVVDEDGFEMKLKSTSRGRGGPGGEGRGGGRGGRGRGGMSGEGRGGSGGGAGRGRGGNGAGGRGGAQRLGHVQVLASQSNAPATVEGTSASTTQV